jgi:hypothetical protein
LPIGPGKYGARAEALLRDVKAEMVIVITVGGSAGDAFDVATANHRLLAQLPTVLRKVATSIEADLRSDSSKQ